MAEAAQKQLIASLKGFLQSGAYSDLTISCGSDKHKVHKVIVCERAGFFKRALRFGGQETEQNVVNLPEDEPAYIKLLLQYLYEGEYDPRLPDTAPSGRGPVVAKLEFKPLFSPPYTFQFPHTCIQQGIGCAMRVICPHHTCDMSKCRYSCRDFNCEKCNPRISLPSPAGQSTQLLTHAKLYEIADKYDVIGLKDLAKEKFNRACQYLYNEAEFAIAASCAFSTTPETDKGLRNIVSDTISAHIELVEKPAIKALLTKFNGLALSILENKINEHKWRTAEVKTNAFKLGLER